MAVERPVLRRVTPDMAREWLARSRQSRLVRSRVRAFARAMRDGEWDPDRHFRQPIGISPGRLSNGNHRLHAVVEHGEPVLMWVKGEP